jgi:hypothetical protein
VLSTQTVSKRIFVSSGQTFSDNLPCPAGTLVVGGGYYDGAQSGSFYQMVIFASAPGTSLAPVPNAWYVQGHNFGTGTYEVDLYASCIQLA